MAKNKELKTVMGTDRDTGKPFLISAADASRIEQITSNFNKLPTEAQNKCIAKLTDTSNFYPDKKSWKPFEKNIIRLVWNKMNQDAICNHFFCSHKSLVEQAYVLGLHPHNDGLALNEDDLDLMRDLQKGGMTIKEVAELFNMEYDSTESKEFTEKEREEINMKQQSLWGEQ